jgi:hypothetical protein
MDLDDMLDDIDIDDIEAKPSINDDILNIAADSVLLGGAGDADDIGDDLQQQMEDAELAAWTNAVAKVSPAVREKWTSLVKADNKCINTNKMQMSYAYKQWNGENADSTKPVSFTPGVSKLLHELVRGSALKATGIEEQKIAKLISLCDPLKGVTGKRLNREFSEQLIKDNKEIIVSDTNYDPKKFPKLAAAIDVV